ncbi:MAG: ATP-binding protein [Eubacteriales bacterium]|nr:ATP-binding protein [Eubacteriales bacterium]
MMEQWEKISYIVQLIAACVLFMVHCRKRTKFVPRVLGCSGAFVLLSYWANSMVQQHGFSVWTVMYWAVFLVACVFFMYLCLDMELLQAAYCAVCACAMQHVAFDVNEIYLGLGGISRLVQVLLYIIVYFLFYRLFAKKIHERGEIRVSLESMFPMVTIIIIVWILSVLENSGLNGFQAEAGSRIFYRVIDGLCCYYVLWVQANQKEKLILKQELDGINTAWMLQKEQYVIKQEIIDNINRKCHDLKHQLQALRQMTNEEEKEAYFNEMEHDIMIYDTAVNTGNKALDVILMDKGLFCKNHDIQWTCMADGSCLSFMRIEDIYAIFGNALDNAITAVMAIRERDKRVVGLKMIMQNNILVIQVQNYYETTLHFEQGLPVTTKGNRKEHGYGMKSIRYIAEKYGGTITVNGQNQVFTLQILIPLEKG